MESFNEVAEKLKTILDEDLTPQEIEELQKVSDQTNEKSKKIQEVLKNRDWTVQGFLYKTGVSIIANKDDYINVSITVPSDSDDIRLNIELKENTAKNIDVDDLKQMILDLEDIIEALK